MSNPFAVDMVKMQVPPHLGQSISVRGFSLTAEADGSVTVPVDVAADLESHGLTRWAAPETRAKK